MEQGCWCSWFLTWPLWNLLFFMTFTRPMATVPLWITKPSLFPPNSENHYFYPEWAICFWNMHSLKKNNKKKNQNFLCLNKKKDTCNIIEKILILEISLLANLIDSFQEKIFSTRPLLLKQYDHMPQSHVIPAVRESSKLQDKGLCRHRRKRKSWGNPKYTKYHFLKKMLLFENAQSRSLA